MVFDDGGCMPSNLSIEERLTRIEMAVETLIAENKEIRQELIKIREEMRSPFRIMSCAIIFFFLIETAVLAKGFGWI